MGMGRFEELVEVVVDQYTTRVYDQDLQILDQKVIEKAIVGEIHSTYHGVPIYDDLVSFFSPGSLELSGLAKLIGLHIGDIASTSNNRRWKDRSFLRGKATKIVGSFMHYLVNLPENIEVHKKTLPRIVAEYFKKYPGDIL